MARNILTVLVAIAVVIVSALTFLNREDGVLPDEKRKMTSFPTLSHWKHDSIKEYFHQMDMYYADRLAFRAPLLTLAAYFPKREDMELPYEGKPGWLFLGNKEERCVDFLVGKLKLSEREVERRASIFAKLKETAEEHGVAFHMMMGPNKSTIYPEYLPKTVIPAEKRFVAPLLAALQKAGIDVYDPTAMLWEHKKDGLLYWRTDSHWNHYGCFLATAKAMEHFGLPFLPPCDAIKDHGLFEGADGLVANRIDFPISLGDNLYPEWEKEPTTPVSDLKVLVVGDSFSEKPFVYIQKAFGTVHRTHYYNIPRKPAESLPSAFGRYIENLPFKPDVVIWIEVERKFAYFP